MKNKLNYVMDIGERMLVSGAEVSRVEDSVTRICRAMGVARSDCFIITSLMVVTVHDEDGQTYTQTRRIRSLGNDFHKLDKLNRLSRRICADGMTNEEIEKEIAKIDECKPYSLPVSFITYAVIAAAFTLFFGGSIAQSLLALAVGCGVRAAVLLSERTLKNPIFCTFTSAAVLTALSLLLSRLTHLGEDEIIIGSIMLLVSGLGFTNALRDLFTGDSISGILRLLEALLGAVAIAAGYFLVSFIGGAIV